jgi:hypothetical protein
MGISAQWSAGARHFHQRKTARTGLFLIRVICQILVAFFQIKYLPSMSEWYSGLISYELLLPIQILLLILMAKININLMKGKSYLLKKRVYLGRFLFWFSIVYATGMLIRYFIMGYKYPDRRWLPPGSIPIFFHWILASYIMILSWITLKSKAVLVK